MLEIYFETYGCTANRNSTEIMKGLVRTASLNITEDEDYSDIVLINSCIVKEPTEEKIRHKVDLLLRKKKIVILAGCMPRLNRKKLQRENLYLLDTRNISKVADLIKDIVNKTYDEKKYLEPKNELKLNFPKISYEKTIGITQISEGCEGLCTYCIVRVAKGKLFSYPEDKILKSVKQDINNGCKEIWITSQDNANYGNENEECALPELLTKILNLKGNFKLRLGMSNPNNVLNILPELIEVYKNPKMFKFLHLPIQAGSDKVLKEMNRGYTKKDVLKIIEEFRKEIPEIVFSTDVIVGYPTETKEDWQETIELIKKIKPEILNRSNFGKRKGTPADMLKEISPVEMKERSNELMKLHLEICYDNQKEYENWEGEVLVDSKGFPGTYLARSNNYKLFAVKSDKNIIGKRVKIKVIKAFPHYLISELI
ncbi:tRNA (N(6)-L-threonylcarbamoyladenosine(37)-C(2))-methylthiotransferase [Candidatus Pacearchaeota archaeon]|nr:tRNA (N(6)-L-threonylcarbamoyladenosine(37)-C(2))-methylthiotransferase [Candidatus Pacearchaeota archaeon]